MARIAILATVCLLSAIPVRTQFSDYLFDTTQDEEMRDYLTGSRGRAAPKAADPCQASYHRVIRNQPQRSYNYRLGSSTHRETVLCDRDLDRGWYRFESLAGNTIPTSCPGTNYCGTRAPVWMKGDLPGLEDGVTEAHACVSVQDKCCATQIPMRVKNCSSFIVYQLEPTPACPSAYCAGYEVPCPLGLRSDTGYTPCHFPVDLLETKVSFSLSKDKSQLHFFCDVTLEGHVVPESVALEVEWLADEESIQSETFSLVQQHKGILKEDKWSVGQSVISKNDDALNTLQCRARAKHTTINTFTSPVTSPPFNTGFVFKTTGPIILHEGGEPGFIEFQSTIPLTCPVKKKKKVKGQSRRGKNRTKRKDDEAEEEVDDDACCITLEMQTRGVNTPRCPDGNSFDLVVLNSCSVKVCSEEWNVTQKIPIWAVGDGLRGGNRDHETAAVALDMRAAENSPPRWQELNFPTQDIEVIPGDASAKCQTDVVTQTFDGLHYTHGLEGVFVLYKHQQLPYEVQVLFRKCSWRPLCNCGVAIRFGDIMLAAEVCKTGKLKLWTFTTEGNYVDPAKLTHFPQITRVDEGRTFQIQFPSGTRVSFGLNLRFIRVEASKPDLEHTQGLCGSFDRNPSNDLKTYKGVVINCPSTNVTCDEFSKAWRLPLDQSLFQGVFAPVDDEDEESLSPGRCSCSELQKPSKVVLRPKSKSKYSSYPYDDFGAAEDGEEETENSKCTSAPCVDPRGSDVTMELLELLQEDDFALEEPLGRESLGNVHQLQSIFLSNEPETKRSWIAEEAEVFCLRAIEGVSTTQLCRNLAYVDADSHRKTCEREVVSTQSVSRSRDALEQLRWECRDEVYHNVSTWEPQLGRQFGTPPQALLSALCLNNCTGLGSCHAGICNCGSGFGGSDCSVNLNEGPQVTYVGQKGVCDLRKQACSEVLVWGTRFAQQPTIKCHFEIYRTVTVKSVPTLSGSLTTEGKLLTFESIICDVPELPIHDAKIASFYIPGEGLDKTRTLMRLSLSYGLSAPRSPALDYTIFDSLCWSCESPLSCVPTPTPSCNVLSEPFGSSSDPLFQSNPSFGEPSHSSDFRLNVAPPPPQQPSHPGLGGNAPCHLPRQPGPCNNDIIRYYFDSEAQKCKPFIYGGCQGNENNFANAESCILLCLKSGKDEGLSSASSGLSHLHDLPPKCRLRPEGASCTDPEIVQFYFDSAQNKCRPTIACRAEGFQDLGTCAKECRKER